MGAKLFQPALFLSTFAHCLCLVVGYYMIASDDVHACVYAFIHACVQLDVVHGCMHGTCMRVCLRLTITCVSQIYDVLLNDTLPV